MKLGVWCFVVTLFCSQFHVNLANSGSLLIGSFNIQIFGQSKVSKSDVLNDIVQIIKRYDVILIQEIRDIQKTAIVILMNHLNNEFSNVVYNYTIGTRQGRSSSKEQYAYIYRNKKVRVTGTIEYDDKNDKFERDPYIVKFQSLLEGIPEFTIIGIHASPKVAEQEIDSLVEVYEFAVEKLGVKNVLIAGDLNADCNYVNKGEWFDIRLWNDSRFHWLIDNSADTTVTDTDCAYDRFIAAGENFVKSISNVKIYHFDKELQINNEKAKHISDHYPIELLINPQNNHSDKNLAHFEIRTSLEMKGNHINNTIIKELLFMPSMYSGVSIDIVGKDVMAVIHMQPCKLEKLTDFGVISRELSPDLTSKIVMCTVRSSMFFPYAFTASFLIET